MVGVIIVSTFSVSYGKLFFIGLVEPQFVLVKDYCRSCYSRKKYFPGLFLSISVLLIYFFLQTLHADVQYFFWIC